MHRTIRASAAAALAAVLLVGAAPAHAVESDPLPVPAGTSRAAAVTAYNAGVALLVERRYAEAQAQFEAALALDEQLAEAHNNLAYSLRMQGGANFDRSLLHYDRAIALKPDFARAYMYRGVLYTQRGDMARAKADLDRLRTLDPALADELVAAIAGRSGGYGRAGIAPQKD
jgi:tetratricopeptide (TPR) repeat protein